MLSLLQELSKRVTTAMRDAHGKSVLVSRQHQGWFLWIHTERNRAAAVLSMLLRGYAFLQGDWHFLCPFYRSWVCYGRST